MMNELRVLRFEFQADVFADAKDGTLIADVIEVFAVCWWWEWHQHFYHYSSDVQFLRTWGTGCDCHEEQLKAGIKVFGAVVDCKHAVNLSLSLSLYIYIYIPESSGSSRELQVHFAKLPAGVYRGEGVRGRGGEESQRHPATPASGRRSPRVPHV